MIGVRGLSTPGGGLSPPPGLGERGPSPLSSPGSASYSQGVQRFSTGETIPSGSVFGNLGGYNFYCFVHQSGSNQAGKHSNGNRES